jgi:predicted ATPase
MISKLHIKNYKCFKEEDLNIKPLTLLSGLNGTGKSTVIQSLLLLRQTYFKNALSSEGLVLNGNLIAIGTGQDALNQNANQEELSFSIKTTTSNESTWVWGYEKSSEFLRLVNSQIDEKLFSNALFSDNFQYLTAERIGPRTSFKTSQEHVRSHRQLGVRGEFTIHFISLFGDEPIPNENLLHPYAHSRSLKSQIDAWMGTISPGTRLKINEHEDIDLVSLRYQFAEGRDLSNEFRSTNVGFGLTNVLPIITAILSSPPGSLLLIENPEAHLHPQGQSEMGKLIAKASNEGVQIILETHSDHVLNGIRVAVKNREVLSEDIQIHFFERNWLDEQLNHHVVSPKIDQNGRLDRWPKGFFDEWDKNLDELI